MSLLSLLILFRAHPRASLEVILALIAAACAIFLGGVVTFLPTILLDAFLDEQTAWLCKRHSFLPYVIYAELLSVIVTLVGCKLLTRYSYHKYTRLLTLVFCFLMILLSSNAILQSPNVCRILDFPVAQMAMVILYSCVFLLTSIVSIMQN